jgi:hypothetical protein
VRVGAPFYIEPAIHGPQDFDVNEPHLRSVPHPLLNEMHFESGDFKTKSGRTPGHSQCTKKSRD